MFGRGRRAPVLLGPAMDTSLFTIVAIAVVQRRVPGIRHSAIYVITGFRQVRISVIVPSSRKLGTQIFRNRPIRPVPSRKLGMSDVITATQISNKGRS